MKIRRLALLALPAAAAVGALGFTVPAHAATPAPVNKNVVCSQGSTANLQLQREDTGKLSVDFGVDMKSHVAGIAWKVKESNNTIAFVKTTEYTLADGSFSVTRRITPVSGVNHIVATATNPATGETCRIGANG
jgi:hypothetical protein